MFFCFPLFLCYTFPQLLYYQSLKILMIGGHNMLKKNNPTDKLQPNSQSKSVKDPDILTDQVNQNKQRLE